jgi:hypothetical protein
VIKPAPRFVAGLAAPRAVVVIVRVVLAAAPFGITEVGLKVQLVWAGKPEQAKFTAVLNPPEGVIVIV